MKVSIFTPTNNTKHLRECYDSIKEQDFHEWVILLNGAAQPMDFGDGRVRYFRAPESAAGNVGALKKIACGECTGDILLEVDHDDILTPDAVSEVVRAFETTGCGFVYSNTAEFMDQTRTASARYGTQYGWTFRPFGFKGMELFEAVTPPPLPTNVSRIWYAPNHLRAWRKDVYDSVGGHNPELEVLDDQDLLCRTYLATEMHHIDKCLYVYRVTGDNTYLAQNQRIQDGVYPLYHKYILSMAIKWAASQGKTCLDFGGRFHDKPSLQSVDLKDADIVTDLNEPWPFADNSVGVIVANDILEHLKNPIHVMKEAHRVLCHGGLFLTSTPSTDGRGAFQDPTHVSFWNQNSFWYYTRKETAAYIDTPVRFQDVNTDTLFYSEWHRTNNIPYVRAHLLALKEGGERIHGILSI